MEEKQERVSQINEQIENADGELKELSSIIGHLENRLDRVMRQTGNPLMKGET